MAELVRRSRLLAACALVTAVAPVAWCALPDPTRPPASPSGLDGAHTGAPQQEVSAVFLLGKHPHAIVDGVMVRVGDPLGDGRVTDIDERGVWIRARGGKHLLPLLPGIQKRRVEGK